MARPGELIHAHPSHRLISSLKKCRNISRQTGGLAGNIEDLLHAVSKDLGKRLGVNAVPGRIQNDQIGLLFNPIEDLQYISGNKFKRSPGPP